MIKSLTKSKGYLLALCFGITMSIISCKKDDVVEVEPPVKPEEPAPTATRTELTKDSIFYYAKEVYFWNKTLPTYEAFNPRKFTGSTDLDAYDAELTAIGKSAVNPATGRPYEYYAAAPEFLKYSYIDDISDNNATQSYVNKEKADVELDDSGFDLGFLWFFPYGENDSNFAFYVMGVFPNSPAAKAGLSRGAVINEVNGQKVGTDYATQYRLIYDIVDKDPSSVKISGFKADGTLFKDVTLTKAKYTSSPVYKTKTITAGTKKIGYLALARFSKPDGLAKPDLDTAFAGFVKNGVTDLVVDLRYNGGGYVETARYLTNLIAPSTATGVMFKSYYNETMQNKQATILKNQPILDENDKVIRQNGKILNLYDDDSFAVADNTVNFKKEGSLNSVKNIVFIVSGNSASASELLINNLKPHMSVKLVGTTTYGKPVGFFPIRLENKYDVYYSMFETKNSLDQGGYYSGMVPDIADNKKTVVDDATYDFGDEREGYLKAAITVLAPAATSTQNAKAVMSIRGKQVPRSSIFALAKKGKKLKHFVGMIETPRARK